MADTEQAISVGSEPGLRSRLLRGMGWSLAGTILSRGATMLAAVIVARIVGREDFGALAVVQTSITLFAVFAGFGISFTAMRNLTALRVADPSRAARILHMVLFFSVASCTLLALVMVLAAPWIAGNVLGAPRLEGLLRIAAVVFLFETMNAAQEGILNGFEAFKAIALTSVLGGLLSVILQTIGVLISGLDGVLWGLVLARIVTYTTNRWQIINHARRASMPRWRWDFFGEWPTLVRFGLPSFISGMIVVLPTWLANAMLVNQPGGFAEMGLFRAANYLFVVFILIGRTLANPFLPVSISLQGAERSRAGSVGIIVAWSIGLIPTLPLILFPELVMLLFGPDFVGERFRINILLALGYTCVSLFGIGFGNIALANDRNWHSTFSNFFYGTVMIGLFWLLLPMGSIGLAVAVLAGHVCANLYMLAISSRGGLVSRKILHSLRSISLWLIAATAFVIGFQVDDYMLRVIALLAGLVCCVSILWFIFQSVRQGTRTAR